jgi:hypothetical protein
MIKTFRGLLADGEQEKIRLSTKKGKVGYTIKSLQLMANNMNEDGEYVISVWKVKQSAVSALYDFSDHNLIAGAFLRVAKTAPGLNMSTIVFDQEVFNQDIYITCDDVGGASVGCNYYMELETTNLTDNAAAVSTLRDIRLNPQVGA